MTKIDWTPGVPDKPGRYLVTREAGYVSTLTLESVDEELKGILRRDGFIAWAPMPEPYRPPTASPQAIAPLAWEPNGNNNWELNVYMVPDVADAVKRAAEKYGSWWISFADQASYRINRVYDPFAVMQYLLDVARGASNDIR